METRQFFRLFIRQPFEWPAKPAKHGQSVETIRFIFKNNKLLTFSVI
jgi:hypothetical protein